MPMSQAALDGIRINGHGWQHTIHLSEYTDRIGVGGLSDEELTDLQVKMVARIREFIAKVDSTGGMAGDLEENAVTLEHADHDIEEVRAALNDLFDSFDFWRVCSV